MEDKQNKKQKKIIIIISIIILIIVAILTYLFITKADINQEDPTWVDDMIKQEETNVNVNGMFRSYIGSIYKCIYKNEIVYYVTERGDDVLNYVFNIDKNTICSKGGFNGKGDGKCSDFSISKNECILIWKYNDN